jgi:hypothetical protein
MKSSAVLPFQNLSGDPERASSFHQFYEYWKTPQSFGGVWGWR